MQLNTVNMLCPLEHPYTLYGSEESAQNIDPTSMEQWKPSTGWVMLWCISPDAPGLKVTSKLCQAEIKVMQEQAYSSLA